MASITKQAMSQMTKQSLADSLKRLLKTKPLAKITISDISEDCGVSRMTFYYHFEDIYDLISWICREESNQAIGDKMSFSTWQEAFTALGHTVLKNRVFIENIYHSVQRERIENYLLPITRKILMEAINLQCIGYNVTQKNKDFIADYFKFAIVGLELDWISSGMEESPETITKRLSILLKGQISLALSNFSEENNHLD